MLPLSHWWLCEAKNIVLYFLVIILFRFFYMYIWTPNCNFKHDIYANCDCCVYLAAILEKCKYLKYEGFTPKNSQT